MGGLKGRPGKQVWRKEAVARIQGASEELCGLNIAVLETRTKPLQEERLKENLCVGKGRRVRVRGDTQGCGGRGEANWD